MRKFVLHFIVFFIICWLVEACAAGSPAQTLSELWRRAFSYHLRDNLVEYPYIVIISLLLALPAMGRYAWMGWNMLFATFFVIFILIMGSHAGLIGYLVSYPVSQQAHLQHLKESIHLYESAHYLTIALLIFCGLFAYKRRLTLLIVIINYALWLGLSRICYPLVELPLAKKIPLLAQYPEALGYVLGLFFIFNSYLLICFFPIRHKWKLYSPEELEWIEHQREHHRQKKSFQPMDIPSVPLPAPLTPPLPEIKRTGE